MLYDKVDDINTVSSNGYAVEVGDEEEAFVNDNDGEDEIEEEPNEDLVHVSVSKAVTFYANLLNMGKQYWENISDRKINDPDDKCDAKFANMVIKIKKSKEYQSKSMT